MLQARGLTKRYGGLLALDRVSFDLHPGEIVGYLGPNGSGKSTTVNLVVGLLEPTAGDLSLCGIRASDDPIAYKRRIGYVPEEPSLYAHLTASDYLMLVGRLRRLPARTLQARVPELLRLLQLHDSRYKSMTAFSKGMRQRVLVAAALLHNPELLVLDEPFSGLDVNAGLLLRTLLRMLAERGPDDLLQHAPLRHGREALLARDRAVVGAGRARAARGRLRARGTRLARGDVRAGDAAAGLRAARAADPRHHRGSLTVRDRPDVVLTRHFFTSLFDFGFLSDEGAESLKRVLLGMPRGRDRARPAADARVHGEVRRALGRRQPTSTSARSSPTTRSSWPCRCGSSPAPCGLVGHSLFPDQTDFRILMAEPLSRLTIFAVQARRRCCSSAACSSPARIVALLPLAALTMIGAVKTGSILASGAGLCVLEPARQPVRGAGDRCRSRPARAARAARAAAGVLGSGAERPHRRARAVAAARGAAARHGRGVRVGRVVAAMGAAGVVRRARALAARRRAPRRAGGAGRDRRPSLVVVVVGRELRAALSPVRSGHRPSPRLQYGTPATMPVRWRRWVGRAPVRHAVRRFVSITIRRSVLHQGLVVGLLAAAGGFVLNSLLSADGWHEPLDTPVRGSGGLLGTLLWAPMTMIFLAIPAIRLALSVPLDLRSNWIFRMTEDVAGRAEVAAANVRIVLALGVALPLALLGAAAMVGAGPIGARRHRRRGGDRLAARRVADGGLAPHPVHVLIHPGKGFVPQMVVKGFASYLFFSLATGVVLRFSHARLRTALVFVAILGAAAAALGVQRWRHARTTSLTFEEVMPSDVTPLGLNAD